jgi:gluconolactonase
MILSDQKTECLTKIPWYTEGPVVDIDGNVFFTTLLGGVILKLDIKGIVSNWAKAKMPNGQIILDDGDHLVCDSGDRSISRFSSEGEFRGNDIQMDCAGKTIHVPNDLAVDAFGGIYFTDSIRKDGQVFYFSRDGCQRRIASHLDYPNGIALSNDGKFLFVAESYRNRIILISLKSPGITEGEWELFTELPYHPSGDATKNLPDGIKIDLLGQLWVAHYGMHSVHVYSESGKFKKSISTDFPLTSNLCITQNELIVTGGYSEPGPGGVLKMVIK